MNIIKKNLQFAIVVFLTLSLQSCSFGPTLKYSVIIILIIIAISLIKSYIEKVKRAKRQKLITEYESSLNNSNSSGGPIIYGDDRGKLYVYPHDRKVRIVHFTTKEYFEDEVTDFYADEHYTYPEYFVRFFLYDKTQNKLLQVDSEGKGYTIHTLPILNSVDELEFVDVGKILYVLNRKAGKFVSFFTGEMLVCEIPEVKTTDILDISRDGTDILINNRSTGSFIYLFGNAIKEQFTIPISSPDDVFEETKLNNKKLFLMNQTNHTLNIIENRKLLNTISLPADITEAIILNRKKINYNKFGKNDYFHDPYYIIYFCDKVRQAVLIDDTDDYTYASYDDMTLSTYTEDVYENREKSTYKGQSGYQKDALGSLFSMQDKYVNTSYYEVKKYKEYMGTKVTMSFSAGKFVNDYVVNDLFYMPECRRDKDDLGDLMRRTFEKISPLSIRCRKL